MGMGSANVFIVEYDLSELVPSFRGVTGALVIDSARGHVNRITTSTNEKQFIEHHGKPNPKKFGLTAYSALNFLKDSSDLKTVRVDKGQTFATGLIRSKIAPIVQYDSFGYPLAKAIVDPIVKPNGPLSATEIENFQFPVYPTDRVVESFSPIVSLLDKPLAGDTTFMVDNSAPVNVGDVITFKDTTGMDREDAMAFQLYTVVSKEQVLTNFDYIRVGGTPIASVAYNTLIQKVNRYYLDTGLTAAATTSGQTDITVTGTIPPEVDVGTVLTFGDDTTNKYTVSVINGQDITLSTALAVNVPANAQVNREDVVVANYLPTTQARAVVSGTTDTIWVANNDPIAEGDEIRINGVNYPVISKYQSQNNVNKITVDTEYVDQTSSVIGDEVYHVTVTDYEQRDAFLVYANTPGEWGNDLAYAIRDSKNYAEAFWIDVYFQGAKVEEFEVTRTNFIDGYGRQMFLEDKINGKSSFISVKNNEFMRDENDELVEPLKTLYYVRQPVATPIYTPCAETQETVWDGDNVIRVGADGALEIDVTKPVKVGNGIYSIASLVASSTGGAIDSIVLEKPVSLGLNNLPPLDRKLAIGSPVSQYFDRAKIVSLTVTASTPGVYQVDIRNTVDQSSIYSKTYSYTAAGGATTSSIATALAGLINADAQGRVHATTVAGAVITLVSAYDGVDFAVVPGANITSTVIQTNARTNVNYLTEKITNTILPTVRIDSEVDLVGGRFTIRDAGANKISGGDDIGYPTIGQYLIALESVLTDRESVDFLVLLDGGITSPAYQQAMVHICEKRQDSVALLSVDFDLHAANDINQTVVARQNTMINSSYAALYAPWTKVYDKYNDFEIFISPESWASRAISYVSANRELWWAAAGWEQGKVAALDVYRRYSEGERDILYDNQINPLRYDPKKGIVIWGQKTMQTKPSALDRLNVRMVLIVIERGLRDYLEYKVFQFNDAQTRDQIKIACDLFLQDILVRRGLYSYNVVCDTTNNTGTVIDNNEMFVDVYLQPTKVAEQITARVVITPTSVSINEVRLTQ